MRIEKDLLGQLEIEDEVYYGIHTKRAMENFNISGYYNSKEFVKSFAEVKLSSALTNKELGFLESDIADAIIFSCNEIIKGKYDNQFVIDAFQGGAGTSFNMNFNEVIANIALEHIGRKKGEYEYINPLNHVNLHQSTNDVYPTALKITILKLLKVLEKELSLLQEVFQLKEREFSDIVKLSRTELQDAIPMTLGMEFGAYAEAISRDRWRVFKARERIKVVNLGGTAIGTGLGASRDYILKVVDNLRKITGLNIARAENLVDYTQNLDSIVEVFAIIKTYAVNLIKISNDLRLLSSGPNGGIAEIILPSVQSGSSIMPGKVNPVILESVIQVALRVISNENAIALSCSMGNLELNHLLPLIAFLSIESLKILINSTMILRDKCIKGIRANKDNCEKYLNKSKTIATVLVPILGYKRVEEIIKISNKEKKSIKDVLVDMGIYTEKEVEDLLNPKRMRKLGYTDDEIKRNT